MVFSGHDADINKLKLLLDAAGPDELTVTLQLVEQERISQEPIAKKRRQLPVDEDNWVKFWNITLTVGDKDLIINGDELHDNHVAQALLPRQFPSYTGFRSTLKEHCLNGWQNNYYTDSPLPRQPLVHCEYCWEHAWRSKHP